MTKNIKTTEDKKQKKTDKKDEKVKAKEDKKSQGNIKKRKKVHPKLTRGRAYIQATYNNTIVTLTDPNGDVVAWSTAGILGFKGAKKATPYAAQKVVEDVVDKIKKTGLSQIDVFVRGIGSGRDSAIRALNTQGLEVLSIKDVTPIPHNGCRPRKVRRV